MKEQEVNDFESFLKEIAKKLPYYDSELVAKEIEKRKKHFASSLNESQEKEFVELFKLVDHYIHLVHNDAFNDGVLKVLTAQSKEQDNKLKIES